MFYYNCCHRQKMICPNMTMAKRKLMLVVCCACICSCAASSAVKHEFSADTDFSENNGVRFADLLFRKYGGDNGFMTLQEFEVLMSNLGLLKNENVTEEQNEIYTNLDDSQSRSDMKGSPHQRKQQMDNRPVNQNDSDNIDRCLSTTEIIAIVQNIDEKKITDYSKDHYSDIKISPVTFRNLCSALIYEMDRKVCYSARTNSKYSHIHYDNISKHNVLNMESDLPESESHLAWLYATISVLVISASGLIGVAVAPFSKSPTYPQLLKFLVALAVGTLCGDALMHLLPHALISNDHSHHTSAVTTIENHHTPMYKCGLTFLTVLLFYILETLLPVFNKGINFHNHSHEHEMKPELGSMLTASENSTKKEFTPIALMIILGDALHNLTDGLAIGAAFSNDSVTGLATSIAVLCHELPHEFGDFAVLLKAGYRVKRVLFFNVMSSFLSLIGMVIGLLLASSHAAASKWIYAATAGSFLYIALADLVPEMAEGDQKDFGNMFIQIGGISLGGIIMLLIALNEDSLRTLFL